MKDEDFKKMVIDAVRKTIKQNERSSNSKGVCKYRGLNNLCCVVGHMMDDESAKAADELNSTAVEEVIRQGVWGTDLNPDQIAQLRSLQYCHDNASKYQFSQEFMAEMRTYPILDWIIQELKEN